MRFYQSHPCEKKQSRIVEVKFGRWQHESKSKEKQAGGEEAERGSLYLCKYKR